MSKFRGMKKTLAVFLAVLMIFSTWGGLTPFSFEASALKAGSYEVDIEYYITNEGSSMPSAYTGENNWNEGDWNDDSNNRAGISLHFKRDNGTGTEGEVYWNVGQSSKDGGQADSGNDATVSNCTGYLDDNTSTLYHAKATIPGFPTNILAYLDYNSSGFGVSKASFKISALKIRKVGATSYTTLWAGTLEVSSHWHVDRARLNSDYTFTDKKGDPTTSTTTSNWNFPKAKTITWDTTSISNITLPSTGTSTYSRTAKFHVVDQYGVNMSTTALSNLGTAVSASVKSTNYAASEPRLGKTTTLGTSDSADLYYTTEDTDSSYNVKVYAKSTLKSMELGLNQRLVTITAKAGSSVSSIKTFYINDPKYTITFDKNDDGGGAVDMNPTSAQVYYGETLATQSEINGVLVYPTSGKWDGYTWLGMFVTEKDGSDKMNIDKQVTAKKTYYAHWNEDTYTVVFLARNGKFLDAQYASYGQAVSDADAKAQLATYEKKNSDSHYKLKSETWDKDFSNVTENLIVTAVYDVEAHNFGAEQALEANCEHGSGTVKICQDCGYEARTITDETLGDHTPSENLTVVVEPTCETEGKGTHYCEVCGISIDDVEIPAIGHSYKVEVTEEATCTETGTRTYACTRDDCDYSYVEDIPMIQHVMDNVGTTSATCTSGKYTTWKCLYCSFTYNDYDADQPAIGHNWGEWEIITPATNDADGEMTRACKNDENHVETVTIPKGDHAFDTTKPTTETPATCHSTGTQTFKCTKHTDCGVSITVTTEKIAHELTTTVTDAKCDADGSVVIACKKCTYQDTKILTALGHNYNKSEVTTAPTCTEKGERTYTCSRCGGTTTEEIAATGHTEVTVDPTCTTEGYTYCAVCNTQIGDKVTATGHKWSETEGDDGWTELAKATCQNVAIYKRVCATCGTIEIKSGEDKAEHNYVGPFLDSEPTCTTDGQKSKHCTVCGDIEEETKVTLPKLGHDYSTTIDTKASTCKEVGYTEYQCSRCGSTEKKYASTLAGHSWSGWEIKQEATATQAGIKVRKCTVCEAKDYEYTAPTGDHTWNDGEVTTEPTCTKSGEKTYTCIKTDCPACGETKSTYTETIPATGHTWDSGTIVDADCTHSGYTHYTCTKCPETYDKVTDNSALGHTWDKGKVTTEPTCTEDGEMTYTCTACKTETKTEVIGKLGHKFVAGDKHDATCTEAGYTVYKCSNGTCGESYKQYDANALGHNWGDWKVSPSTGSDKVVISRTCENDANHKEEYTVSVDGAIVTGDHEFEVTSTKTPTCHSKGEVVLTCKTHKAADGTITCGCKATVILPETQHNLKTDYTAPTCENSGSIKVYCTADGCTYVAEEKALEALGHDYKAGTHYAADCTHSGYTEYTCQRTGCGDKINVIDDDKSVGTHKWKDTPKSSTADCTHDGELVYECETCSSTITVKTDALGHDWDDGVVIVEGDCENREVTRYTCKRGCGATIDVLTGTGVSGEHSYEFSKTVEPTCTEDGYDEWVCKECGGIDKRNIVEAKGHDWGNWTIVTYPTETENGLQRRQCLVCGEPEEQVIVWGKFYLVTFYNYDGKRLMPPAYYQYGAQAIKPKTDPIKVDDSAYTYKFIGYNYTDEQLNFVCERMAVIAQYEATERHYNVTYVNEDGTTLGTINDVAYSQIGNAYIEKNGKPTKASDKYYDYTFASWSISCDTTKGTAVAVASYKATNRPPEPSKDDTGSDNGENLFTRIINWIKNLFNKIFGR